MNYKIISIILISIVTCLNSYSQNKDSIIQAIRIQAELVGKSVFTQDYESLLKYTHPNIVNSMGGDDVFIAAVERTMKELEESNLKFISFKIRDSIQIATYENEYHCIVPVIQIISIDGNEILSRSKLFGFSDLKGMNWTFVEADKLASKEGSRFFPNFKTNLDLKKDEKPILLNGPDNDPEYEFVNIEITWEAIAIKKRHDIENLIDAYLRKKDFGHCHGGTNGKDELSFINVLAEIKTDEIDFLKSELKTLLDSRGYPNSKITIQLN